MQFDEVVITTIIAVLFELTLHWFPWRLMLRRDLSRQETYVMGIMGIAVPLSFLWARHGYWDVFNSLWTVIFSVGFFVMLAYRIDELLVNKAKGEEARELLDETRPTRQKEH